MANPNIMTATSVLGKSAGQQVTTTATAIVSNGAGSNQIFKINSLIVANVNGTSAADITVDLFKNQTTAFDIAFTVSVPADATLVVISKDAFVYLEENDSLRLTASANSFLEAVCSYEIVTS